MQTENQGSEEYSHYDFSTYHGKDTAVTAVCFVLELPIEKK